MSRNLGTLFALLARASREGNLQALEIAKELLLIAVYGHEWYKEFSPYEALADLLGANRLANLNARANRVATERAREAEKLSTDVDNFSSVVFLEMGAR